MPEQLGDLRPYLLKVLNPLGDVEGTGFLCHPEGYALTCWHVLESWRAVGKTQGSVLFRGEAVPAEWIPEHSVEAADIAVLGILKRPNAGPSAWPWLPLDVHWRVQVSDQLYSFGYPAGQFANAGISIASKLEGLTPTQVKGVEVFPLVGFNMENIDSGYSGAPVVNETTQRVIGLVYAKHHETEAFIIPMPKLFEVWPELRAKHEGEKRVPNRLTLSSTDYERRESTRRYLSIEQIETLEHHREDVEAAFNLNASRLPEDERYDTAELIELVGDHLSGQFGPHRPSMYWKCCLLVAKHTYRNDANDTTEIVGMLLAYTDLKAATAFVSYLVAKRPRRGSGHPDNISEQLLRKCLEVNASFSDANPRLRFLAEVDHPVMTGDRDEQDTRLARIKLFEKAARVSGLPLLCLDLGYVQPKLDPSRDKPEKRMLLLYATLPERYEIPREEAVEVLTWLYTQLYSEDIFWKTPAEAQQYGRYLRDLLARAIKDLPDHIRLLRARQLFPSAYPQ